MNKNGKLKYIIYCIMLSISIIITEIILNTNIISNNKVYLITSIIYSLVFIIYSTYFLVYLIKNNGTKLRKLIVVMGLIMTPLIALIMK